MRQKLSYPGTQTRVRGALALAGLVGALALFGASPALAGNDFRNGFEDELGRVAAHAVVNAGVVIATGGYYAPGYAYRPYPQPYYYRPVPVVRHVVRHHYVPVHYGWCARHSRWDDDGRGHRGHGPRGHDGHRGRW